MMNKLIARTLPYFPKKFVWIFSRKYIAGETIDEAILASRQLNEKGMLVTVDLLGEFITNLEQAKSNKDEYLAIIERFEAEKIKGNYSLKPTSFGLLLDAEVCYEYVREIVAKAAEYNNFVRIDMEDSKCVDLEIDMFRRIKAEFPKHVGLVFQAYLKRTMPDLEALMDIHSEENPINYRLCKGIYVEPKEIAYKDYHEVNEHYLKDLEYLLKNKVYVGIATHDRKLVEGAIKIIEENNIPGEHFEFQMLYGVTPELRKEILSKGYKMRVYVPYGKDWFGYSTRRLKENPKMASHIIKSLFIKG
ncbi:proline dehydrogenase family protein [Carboxylicivirga mesophila]|uniref:proline dehydrogenase n=1 Tax=Carboxylicivirga mesophila TaxID=1166478 RepID=A0ABS5K6D2_9BACT|nr:proline dehydrogenase family protein [Carboxylicivirga mesophila]MBS2210467.1 proline dehydrogenase family protein [Carboxylicivirga mesophila]